jgi:hypothetical protein
LLNGATQPGRIPAAACGLSSKPQVEALLAAVRLDAQLSLSPLQRRSGDVPGLVLLVLRLRLRSERSVLSEHVVIEPEPRQLLCGALPHVAVSLAGGDLAERVGQPPGLPVEFAVHEHFSRLLVVTPYLDKRALDPVALGADLVRRAKLTLEAIAAGA